MPEGKRIRAMRADSGAYQAEVMKVTPDPEYSERGTGGLNRMDRRCIV